MAERKNGDAYVELYTGAGAYNGKYVIRFERGEGVYCYSGTGGLFGSIRTFETAGEAQAYIDSHTVPKKPISKESVDFIRQNIDGEIKRGYLYNSAGDQRIKLVRETLEFYNSLKTA